GSTASGRRSPGSCWASPATTGSRPVSRPPRPWSTASPVIGMCQIYSNERCHQELRHEAIDRGCTLDREAVSTQSPHAGRDHEENTPAAGSRGVHARQRRPRVALDALSFEDLCLALCLPSLAPVDLLLPLVAR